MQDSELKEKKYFYNLGYLKSIYEDYKKQSNHGIKCGFEQLDNIVRLDKGQFCVITAKANVGKSTFINYYCSLMYKNNNLNTAFISFENSLSKNIDNACKLFNCDIDKTLKAFSFINTENISTMQDVYCAIKEANDMGNDIVVIDTFNYLPLFDYDTNAIGLILKEFCRLAKQLNIILILVAHPTKLNGNKINGESISGSIHFRNMADTLIVMDREQTSNVMTVTVDKLRNNIDMGKCGESINIEYNYQTSTYNYIGSEDNNNDTDKVLDRIYNEVKTDQIQVQIHEDKQTITDNNKVPQMGLNEQIKEELKPLKLSDIQVSYYDSITAKEAQNITLEQAIHNYKVISKIDTLRSIKDEVQYKGQKKKLPLFSVSASFNGSHNKDNIEHYNSLIAIDIDGKDNADKTVNELTQTILNSDLKHYIYYCAKSCGGNGLYCIIQINGDISNFSGHFKALEEDFKAIGITIDNQCKDVSRLRFSSYDMDEYINEVSKTYTKELIEEDSTNSSIKMAHPTNTFNTKAKIKDITKDTKLNKLLEIIDRDNINIVPTHTDTLNVRSYLIGKYSEKALKAWLLIKSKDKCYNEQIERNKFYSDLKRIEECNNLIYPSSKFWNMIRQYNIEIN